MDGYILVQVYTADRAIPIRNAVVLISKTTPSGEEAVRILRTDRSGRTEIIGVPAPPAANSQSPGNENNFSRYNIRVDYPGYRTVENLDVPVFEGQTSIQSVGMIPLAESEQRGRTVTVTDEEPFGNQ